jgi:hypothetical protein
MTSLALALLLALATLGGCARKTPAVVCTCNYGGELKRLEFPATRDPYAVKSMDIAGRFRFKAVYLRETWTKASVSIYAYHHGEQGDVLLQEGKYTPPFSTSTTEGTTSFTGRQLLYAPDEHELEYWCGLSP